MEYTVDSYEPSTTFPYHTMSTIADRSFERKEKHRKLVIDFVMKYVANPLQDEAIKELNNISYNAGVFALETLFDQTKDPTTI